MNTDRTGGLSPAALAAAVIVLIAATALADCKARTAAGGRPADVTRHHVTEENYIPDHADSLLYKNIMVEKNFGGVSLAGTAYVLDSVFLYCSRYIKDTSEAYLPDPENHFADDIFLELDDDIKEDRFAVAVKRCYDGLVFLNHLVSLMEIRECQEMARESGSKPRISRRSPLGKVIRPSAEALDKAFPSTDLRQAASIFLTSLYKDADMDAMYNEDYEPYYDAFTNMFTNENPIDTVRLRKAEKEDSLRYDKSQFVKDFDRFKVARAFEDSLKTPSGPLERDIWTRMDGKMDFDTKCIYGIELNHLYYSSVYQLCGIDILGALIESREYSRYLPEVWMNWRAAVQFNCFGSSSSSLIPNAYYAKVRNICMNTMIRHILSHPSDDDAILRLWEMMTVEPIKRNGFFGNTVIKELYDLRNNY